MKYAEKESSTLELKESLPQNNQIVKTVIGFCNQKGGKIIIGISNDGTIKGLSEAELERALEYLDKTIFDATCPPINPWIYTQILGDKTVLVIEVGPGMAKPYYLKNEGAQKGVFVRLGRSTMQAPHDLIKELIWEAQGRSFDTMPVLHAQKDDLDSNKITKFLEVRTQDKKNVIPLEAAMKAYQLVIQVHAHQYPTVAGMLLFGHNPNNFFSEAFIICTIFAGTQGREALATRDCEGTLFEQYSLAYNFVLSQLNRSFTIRDSVREEEYEMPPIAIREAIINALMHRNYHIPAPTKISIYNDRIEIFSPGSFLGPIKPDEMQMGLTYTRNRAIAKVFREAGYSEKLGTGFITIFSSFKEKGLREPLITEGMNFVKCIFYRPSPTEKPAIALETDITTNIIHLFESSVELSVGDIIQRLSIPRSTLGRKLSELVKKGLIEKVGSHRMTRYRLIKKS
jgi:ATP-dependent DNA helicase RecG